MQVCKRSIFLGSPNLASVVAMYVYFKMTSDVFAAYFVRSRSSAEYFLRLLIQYISAPFIFFLKPPKVRRLCIKALFCFLLEVVFICWLDSSSGSRSCCSVLIRNEHWDRMMTFLRYFNKTNAVLSNCISICWPSTFKWLAL